MRKMNLLFAVLMIPAGSCFAENVNPAKVFEEVVSAYKSLQTYKAEGVISADINTGDMNMTIETSFSILLKKPNLYLISWTQKNIPMAGMTQSGTVWNDGNQPQLYMGISNEYVKMVSDEMALASATGISGGAAYTIPSLFLGPFKGQSNQFSILKDPSLEKTEKIGDEECYVISGASPASKKETFWISASRHLILKYSRSFESSGQTVAEPELTDEQIEEMMKGMGLEITEESKKKMKERMKEPDDEHENKELRGSSTESYVKISSPELSAKDFNFTPPPGAVLKKSLFDF